MNDDHEILEPSAAEVKAARRTRESIAEAARMAGEGSGTVRLEGVDVPASVLRAMAHIVHELAEGRAVAVRTLSGEEEEVTTSQAARLLGMSRPTLIDLLERGEIPYRMVGTHRRIPRGAVMDFRRRTGPAVRVPTREERERGLREMAEYTDRLGLGY